MPRLISVLCFALVVGLMSGCAAGKKNLRAYEAERHRAAMSIPVYSGPRARIAVGDFDVKAPKATSQVGLGLRSMLSAAFLSSGRFALIDAQTLGAQSVEKDTKAKTPDVVVMIALEEFEPEASGGRSGIGGGGGVGSGTLGGLLGAALSKAHAALSIRLVDVFTSEVLATGRVEGQAFDTAGVIMNGVPGNLALGGGLSSYANTPMEKAIRILIAEAVKYVSTAVPGSYYKY